MDIRALHGKRKKLMTCVIASISSYFDCYIKLNFRRSNDGHPGSVEARGRRQSRDPPGRENLRHFAQGNEVSLGAIRVAPWDGPLKLYL